MLYTLAAETKTAVHGELETPNWGNFSKEENLLLRGNSCFPGDMKSTPKVKLIVSL